MADPANRTPAHSGHVGHETTDASPLALGLFALGLTLMIAIVLPLLSWMFWRLEGKAERADPAQSPLAVDQVPPPPRLEVDPGADLARLRGGEEKTLSSYGWIDRQQGIVRVPIDRAIDLLAERGLPEPKAKSSEPAKKPEPAKKADPGKEEPKP